MNICDSVILVVDDKPANLDVLFDLFADTNFEVSYVNDGKSCLELADLDPPDLILLDIMMPDMDGFEVCRRLKANERTKGIPVIFMSALAETVDKVKGFELGAVDYITKPIQPEEVLARVNTHLGIQKLQDELQAKNALLADREVHLTRLVEEKTQKIEAISIALVNALENASLYNDLDTGNHIKRIGEYCAFIAEQYGSDREFVKRIKLYAPLHDVGKVGLPDALLKKPGTYTPEEFTKMQEHVIIGARMLESHEIDVMARNIVLYHHEKWDGTGYVHQLTGEAIPLEARIVALADVYDALMMKRVYKDVFSEEKAERIIREESGRHFDPKIVDIFLDNRHAIRNIRRSFL